MTRRCVAAAVLTVLAACGDDDPPPPRPGIAPAFDVTPPPAEVPVTREPRPAPTVDVPSRELTRLPHPPATPTPPAPQPPQSAVPEPTRSEAPGPTEPLPGTQLAALLRPGACVDREAAASRPGGFLTLEARATVMPSGRITQAQVLAPGQPPEALACLREQLQGARLPQPPADAPTEVRGETRLRVEPLQPPTSGAGGTTR